MTYIFLIAGKGTRLHPLTLTYPKTLFKLYETTTVFERMVSLIQKYDQSARIIAVTGFEHKKIEALVKNVEFIHNPFYAVTNSIASLWFAREYLSIQKPPFGFWTFKLLLYWIIYLILGIKSTGDCRSIHIDPD